MEINIEKLKEVEMLTFQLLDVIIEPFKKKIEQLEMDLTILNTEKAAYYEGQDNGVQGVLNRWREALATKFRKSGAMSGEVEILYRQTEGLVLDRNDNDTFFKGQADGWIAVVETLNELDPMWFTKGRTGKAAACNSIKALAYKYYNTELSFRDRLTNNAEDFDSIVTEILAENESLKADNG